MTAITTIGRLVEERFCLLTGATMMPHERKREGDALLGKNPVEIKFSSRQYPQFNHIRALRLASSNAPLVCCARRQGYEVWFVIPGTEVPGLILQHGTAIATTSLLENASMSGSHLWDDYFVCDHEQAEQLLPAAVKRAIRRGNSKRGKEIQMHATRELARLARYHARVENEFWQVA